jgi:hypothetical protein
MPGMQVCVAAPRQGLHFTKIWVWQAASNWLECGVDGSRFRLPDESFAVDGIDGVSAPSRMALQAGQLPLPYAQARPLKVWCSGHDP